MGAALVFAASLGFYFIDDMIETNASGSKLVNAFYCAVITLTTVGYGDICPTKQAPLAGKLFIVLISFLGLGVFCGPLLAVTSSWRHTIPGGLFAVALWTLAMGVMVFTYEGISTTDALYASVITGTTIGYGDLTPTTEVGKILVALYAVLVVGVTGVLLDISKERLIQFCIPSPPKIVPDKDDKKEK
ncbi:ion channel [Fragilaria crotonensis]|nr:ion channel [Fragilaria crotonensis]